MTVVMDTRLTPELIEEGFVRELISKIQTMRKEAGFEAVGPQCDGAQPAGDDGNGSNEWSDSAQI